jgi:hypothetical protein
MQLPFLPTFIQHSRVFCSPFEWSWCFGSRLSECVRRLSAFVCHTNQPIVFCVAGIRLEWFWSFTVNIDSMQIYYSCIIYVSNLSTWIKCDSVYFAFLIIINLSITHMLYEEMFTQRWSNSITFSRTVFCVQGTSKSCRLRRLRRRRRRVFRRDLASMKVNYLCAGSRWKSPK